MLFSPNHYEYELFKLYNRKAIYEPNKNPNLLILFVLIFFLILCILAWQEALGSIPKLPGTDQSDKLQAAGTLLRIIDSVLFSWGARLMAGLCVLGAGWNLKNQAFGLAVMCIIAAIIMGTAPMWVKNIFDMGGGTLFSMIQQFLGNHHV